MTLSKPNPIRNPQGKSGWQQKTTAADYPDESHISPPHRERKLNPRTPRDIVKAITDILNIQDVHTHESPPHERVRALIHQRDTARREMMKKVLENAILRAENRKLKGEPPC